MQEVLQKQGSNYNLDNVNRFVQSTASARHVVFTNFLFGYFAGCYVVY